MKKVLAALCMIVLFCIVFLSISGCTEEEKTEEANQSNYGKQQCFEHNFGMYLVEIAPTCTEKGIESAYCAVCGEKSVREIQPLGHDLEGLPCEGRHCTRCDHTEDPTTHVYDNTEEIPADCFNSGWTIYSCECGDSYMEEVPASGHSFGEWQVSTPSTCIKEGVEKRVCERCGEEEVRSIPEAEHVFSEWTVTKEPDCTEAGSQERICSVCHKTETAEIPAVGHKYGLVEECPATCAKNGKKIFECSVCHDIKEEITEDKLNHDFGGAAACAEGVTCIRCGKERLPLPHSHATREIEPTCTESGYSEEYCTECGKIFAKIEKAVVIDMPISAQNDSNCRFKSASIRILILVLAIAAAPFLVCYSKYNAFYRQCQHNALHPNHLEKALKSYLSARMRALGREFGPFGRNLRGGAGSKS